MKKFLMGLMVFMVVLLPSLCMAAPALVALSADEAAYAQATHALDVNARDCTLATTNTAQLWTNAIPAGTYVKCVGAKLLTTFDTGKTNSVKLVVGETSGGTNFVNVTELAVNSTPRYWRSGGTADTNNVVTADNYYTAATNVYVSLTPTGSALSDNTRGKVRVYFQLR